MQLQFSYSLISATIKPFQPVKTAGDEAQY